MESLLRRSRSNRKKAHINAVMHFGSADLWLGRCELLFPYIMLIINPARNYMNGLGLFICKRLMSPMGGKVNADIQDT